MKKDFFYLCIYVFNTVKKIVINAGWSLGSLFKIDCKICTEQTDKEAS